MKKLLSVILSLAMILSVTANLTITASAATGSDVVEYARQYIGTPYALGANGPDSFDSYGFVQYVFNQFNISLPDDSSEYWENPQSFGTVVESGNIENAYSGDVITWSDHVAIYTENGCCVEALDSVSGVSENKVDSHSDSANYKVIRVSGISKYAKKPYRVKLSLEKTSFFSCENIVFYLSGKNASYYTVTISDENSNIIETANIISGEYCIRNFEPGTYSAYCEAFNDLGSTLSNSVKFTVKQSTLPKNVALSIDKAVYSTAEEISFNCVGNDVSYFVISVLDENENENEVEIVKINDDETFSNTYSPGSYTAYLEAFNACGAVYSNDVLFTVNQACENHVWDSGKTTKAATCTKEGVLTYSCTVCGESKTQAIKATGHKYVEKFKAATFGTNGYRYKICKNCSKKKDSVTISAPSKITFSKTSYVYDGKAKKPTIKIYDKKGETLTAKEDYKVQYQTGRKDVGEYAVKITFKGDYSGEKIAYFKINPKGTSISKLARASKALTVTWKKQATQTTGYQIQYSTNSNFTGDTTKTITLSSNQTTSKKITSLKGNKKYFIRVRTYKTVKTKRYYSSWSSAKSITTKK